MGYPTKVQLIQRKESQQWYINFPAPLAEAMDFSKGEVIEWTLQDRATLILTRKNPPSPAVKKNARTQPRT